jgi:putative hemolysin
MLQAATAPEKTADVASVTCFSEGIGGALDERQALAADSDDRVPGCPVAQPVHKNQDATEVHYSGRFEEHYHLRVKSSSSCVMVLLLATFNVNKVPMMSLCSGVFLAPLSR